MCIFWLLSFCIFVGDVCVSCFFLLLLFSFKKERHEIGWAVRSGRFWKNWEEEKCDQSILYKKIFFNENLYF